MKPENVEKIEKYIENFYKDLSRMNLNKWTYEDGCLLIAAIQLYEATGKQRFRDFVIEYADHFVAEDGSIFSYKKEDFKLDDINPGRGILFAYEQTGNEKYKKAIDILMGHLDEQPRTLAGSFWHKLIYPNQVWLDGLFMAQPFYMAYNTKYGKKDRYVDICTQFENARNTLFDSQKELYYHGYDESRSIFWADKETGCSANFWLRAIGWYLVSLVDTMEEMDGRVYDHFRQLADIYKQAVTGVLKYQDKDSKLFYQVVDHPETEGNYLETSGSAMIADSILKACRLKVLLAEKYQQTGEDILEAIIEQKLIDGKLKDNCSVAGLGPKEGRRDGSIEYYLSEPIKDDDGKGVAAMFMAYAQYLKLRRV